MITLSMPPPSVAEARYIKLALLHRRDPEGDYCRRQIRSNTSSSTSIEGVCAWRQSPEVDSWPTRAVRQVGFLGPRGR